MQDCCHGEHPNFIVCSNLLLIAVQSSVPQEQFHRSGTWVALGPEQAGAGPPGDGSLWTCGAPAMCCVTRKSPLL